MKWIILFVALSFNALANIFIKAGTKTYTGKMDWKFVLFLITNKFVILGVISFFLALIGYSYALTKFPLNIAYPIMTGCGFAIVATASYFVFGESFGLLKFIGIFLIFIGIIFLSR